MFRFGTHGDLEKKKQLVKDLYKLLMTKSSLLRPVISVVILGGIGVHANLAH